MSNFFNSMFEGGVGSMVGRFRVRPRFWLALSLVAVLVFSVSFLVTGGRLRADASTLADKTAARDQIVREIGTLEKELSFAQTDAFVERAARDALGLIRPGEIRYVNGSNP